MPLHSELLGSLSDRIRQSDEDAFDHLFRQCYKPLVAYSFRFLKSKEEAKDIVQDVFVKLWDIRLTLHPGQSPSSLLYTMVRNASLNNLKSTRLVDIDTIPEQEEALEEPDFRDHPSVPILLSDMVKGLPPRQREAFELSRFGGLTHEEIAKKMNCTPRTVNNHIMAALKNLKVRLEPHMKLLRDL